MIQNMHGQFCRLSLMALCALSLVFVVMVLQNVEGETITVDDDGGADYDNSAFGAAATGGCSRSFNVYMGNQKRR